MKTKYLSEVTNIKSGNSAPQGEEPFVNGKYNFYRTYDVGQIKQGEIFESRDKVNEETYSNLKIFPVNTILFPKSGASTFNNNRVIIKKEGAIASHLAGIKANPEFLNDYYLYYFLLTIDSKNLAQDSAYPSVNLKQISQIKIPVPSLQEQEKIVEKLDKVEKRNIELHKVHTKQLIDLQNLYEGYLSGSFSKMNKNLTPLQLSTINITDGSHNPAKGVDKSDYMMLSSKNVTEDDLNFENPRYLKKEDFLLENKRTNLETNDVLLTIVGTIGRTAVVKSLEHNITFQRSVCVIKPNKEILDSYYLKYFLDNISGFLEKNAKGVAQKGIYLKQIRAINIPLMDLDRQQQLVTKIKKVNNLIKEITNKKKDQILKQEQLKKSILNKEFSYE